MRSQRGLSFIELIIFIVVVSVGVVGILSVFNVTVKSSADPLIRKQSIAVAEAMLSEILAKSFTDVGIRGTATSRADFDDICDYNGYNRTGIVTINNKINNGINSEPVEGLKNYSVSVIVSDGNDLSISTSGDTKKVSVTVTGGGNSITLVGYRTNY